jgi:acetyl esterase/lipase
MASTQVKVAKWFLRNLRGMVSKYFSDLKKLRTEKHKWFKRMWPPRSVRFEQVEIAGLPAQWCYPPKDKDTQPERVLYYVHGGGFASCSPQTHWGLIGKLALTLGLRVLCMDYRLSPEFPFPAALDDTLAGFEHLLKSYAPQNIIVVGDSAGGGLSLSLLLKLREQQLPQPLTAVLLSPWTDLTMSGDSIKTREEFEPLLPVAVARQWAEWYIGDADPKNPLLSPLFADLNDLCPMLVHVGTDEILLDDSTRLLQRAANTNTQIKLEVWDAMFHVWHMAWRTIPEAGQAIKNVVEYINLQIAMQQRREAEQLQNTL